MDNLTILNWLNQEVSSAKCALLTAYEQRDKLIHIIGPQIERKYMEEIGEFEQTIIKEEIECELLEEKKQLIQTSINRREPIDENIINQKIEERRRELMKDAEGNFSEGIPSLSSEQTDELQKLYSDIVQSFHPQTHSDITETQKELYQKALEAYRRNDLESMKLVHEMIFSTEESGISLSLGAISFEITCGVIEDEGCFSDDFTLVSEIFENFSSSLEEIDAKQQLDKYRFLIEEILHEIAHLKNEFPFSAEDMLNDETEVATYKNELNLRLQNAKLKRTNLENDINTMMKGAVKA